MTGHSSFKANSRIIQLGYHNVANIAIVSNIRVTFNALCICKHGVTGGWGTSALHISSPSDFVRHYQAILSTS